MCQPCTIFKVWVDGKKVGQFIIFFNIFKENDVEMFGIKVEQNSSAEYDF